MPNIAWAGFFATLGLLAQSSPQIASIPEARSFLAFSSQGPVSVQAVKVPVDVTLTSGVNEHGNLAVFYVPGNGLYLWDYIPARYDRDQLSALDALAADECALFVSPSAIYLFVVGTSVNVLARGEHADSLGTAKRLALQELQKGRPMFSDAAVARDIGGDFACDPEDRRDNCGFAIKQFVSVKRDGDYWNLVVRNRRDQTIVLNSQFQLVSTYENDGHPIWKLPEPLL